MASTKAFPTFYPYGKKASMMERFSTLVRHPLTAFSSLLPWGRTKQVHKWYQPENCPVAWLVSSAAYNTRSERTVVCEEKHTDETFEIRLEMPGIQKKDLRVWVEDNCVKFKAEESNYDYNGYYEAVYDDMGRNLNCPSKYIGKIRIPEDEYDECEYELDKTQGVIGGGVLKLLIPKRMKKNMITIKEWEATPIEWKVKPIRLGSDPQRMESEANN